MTENLDDIVGINFKKPVIKVKHKELKRFDPEGSLYKSVCPTCHRGVLMVGRNMDNFKLEKNDYCILCGQHFYYTDLEYLDEPIYEGEKVD